MSTPEKAQSKNVGKKTPDVEKKLNDEPQKEIHLTHKEAKAASPDDYSVGGEEDPGEGLESLVDEHKK